MLGRPGHDGGGLAPVIILRGVKREAVSDAERRRLKYECASHRTASDDAHESQALLIMPIKTIANNA